ncbi:Putative peptidoglycan binding domain-containing protein [Enhydrobacter aerosaccus]|uniref:Putative peptidoglycan binding domain-containing protein n=1 Tax=Enhydrobacter aerosaccus TaxID=225324 RepID=A0A1T4RVT6_9HYPH|nr:serine/threonine-protein kinase [Enhydrobacter aerosaccus]SKA19997.1 Putative peptidoglycan binding domain-containing protein [Enhydrobacter aerosaccus]
MSDATSGDQNLGPNHGPASEVDFVALAPGQKVGRYEIVAILGQGGFGITYRARDSQLNRDVAIKEYLPSALAVRQDGSTVLPRSTRMSDDFTWGRQRFVDEGRTLATLQRAPAIVRVFDFLEANGTAYIVMELVPGTTLEDRLKGGRTLSPDEVNHILWPLLDGLEQVHATGFLHRDIKPANILLDAAGNPTLIDFGASRAAMAGRTTAMTAIFTPGYAAAEQFTSAKQGPWTDIYGLSATMYHAITGAPPPSAFDRILDDSYRPLGQLRPAGFALGLLVGLDTGLAVRALDRPQSIAGWRPVLTQTAPVDADVTVMVRAPADPTVAPPEAPASPVPSAPSPALPAGKSRTGLWLGAGALAVLMLGGGYYALQDKGAPKVSVEQATTPGKPGKPLTEQAAATPGKPGKAPDGQPMADQQAAEAAQRQKLEDESRQKMAADQAAKQQAEEDAKQKAVAEEAARRKAEEEDRKSAQAAEEALHLTLLDRQHVQVALTALGFSTNGSDGVFGGHTRDMIAAWQKSRGFAATGFLTGMQNQTLLRDASPAIAKFDEDQKKADEATSRAKVVPASPSPAQPATAAASASVAAGADGLWRGSMHCSANRGAGPFNAGFEIRIAGGTGTWVRPGSGPGTTGNQSITLKVTGNAVLVQRLFVPLNNANAPLQTATMPAQVMGDVINGSGPEAHSGGRTCEIVLNRVSR